MRRRDLMEDRNMTSHSRQELHRLLHGWLSLLLMVMVCMVGAYAVLRYSAAAAGTYAFVVVAGMAGVLAAFCAKCPCRLTGCRHIVLGPLSTVFPKRREGAYSVLDILLTGIGFGAIVLFPQYWLVRHIPLLVLFWALVAVLLAEISLFICKRCENSYCPAKR